MTKSLLILVELTRRFEMMKDIMSVGLLVGLTPSDLFTFIGSAEF
jgi:hypothetical protein